MRRILVPLALACALALPSGGPALAKPPPPLPAFTAASAALTPTGRLVVSFAEANLGGGAHVAEQATATALMTYACAGGPGQNVGGSDQANATFAADKHGDLGGSLTLIPLGAFIPCGTTPVLVAVRYTNVQIADATDGVTKTIPGTFEESVLPPLACGGSAGGGCVPPGSRW